MRNSRIHLGSLQPIIILFFIFSSCEKDDTKMEESVSKAQLIDNGIQQDNWIELTASPPIAPSIARHDDITFLDSQIGYLINIDGEVHQTQNGGDSWTLVDDGNVQYRCVGFANQNMGWIGNINFQNTVPGASLYETVDGGDTWQNISTRITGDANKVYGLCGMRVLDDDNIMAVGRWHGPAVFVKSQDGGATWIAKDLSSLASGLVDVHFFNSLEGIAVGSIGDGRQIEQQNASQSTILSTSDGGVTWKTAYKSQRKGERAWKVYFINRDVGYVTTEGATPEGSILKTIDGGVSWKRIQIDEGQAFEGIAFVDSNTGWVASWESMYATTDGGNTWTKLNYGKHINRIWVVNSNLVFAAGEKVYKWTQ